jgi:hypothetical protein
VANGSKDTRWDGFGYPGQNLVGWAISQLSAMKSPLADAELQRYLDEMAGLPNGSTLKNELALPAERIRGVLDDHASARSPARLP